MIIYLFKHSKTELSNAVRELSKCMYQANMSLYKAFLREIKYAIDRTYYSAILNQTETSMHHRNSVDIVMRITQEITTLVKLLQYTLF